MLAILVGITEPPVPLHITKSIAGKEETPARRVAVSQITLIFELAVPGVG